MDTVTSYFISEIFGALTEGDRLKLLSYIAIFFFLWLEVRGLKKAVKGLGDNIGKSFKDGEKRFDAIEVRYSELESRFNELKCKKT